MSGDVKDDHSVAAHIAQSIAARIVSGELAPDERLKQDEWADAFSTSHVPVREAFRRLEAQGLVVAEPRRGVRVAPLDVEAVVEVARMRAALEPLALRYAIPRYTEDDLALAASFLEVSAPSGDIAALERVNRGFHQAITTPCGMPRVVSVIADLHQASARHLFAAWKWLDWRARSDNEHVEIFDAACAGRVDEACERLAAHIADAGQALTDALRHKAIPAGPDTDGGGAPSV
ncbi:GntR family transcriptional regulator [Burkholderia lata]|uniref:GntR family transcriptional regulator n=1 Tax=Burkholderia lata (strain ATCC 17760 / DSM 23089 / LMG 22485 / NCIMB 9086 / R18194 / 383) TaxID=482957 RepID=A0A6P2L689_BURL3|nr:GntR family transcriptional regulator [Burkholderia lata]VWB62792.1 GntR family transcriptional regulator [Burkholderia lata]